MATGTSAKDGSVAVSGDNSGNITNITLGDGSSVNLRLEAELARKLPSHLGAVIARLASQSNLPDIGAEAHQLPAEIVDKLKHNNLPARHPIIRDWTRHSLALARAYHGIEQQNADARYLVRQRAGRVYGEELLKEVQTCRIPEDRILEFVRERAVQLVASVTDRLLADYRGSSEEPVVDEVARLAVSLVVADAVVECEVLERPNNATAS